MTESNYKFHGVHIEEEEDAILRLYARYYGVSLSPLIRKIIHDWIKDKCLNKEELIQKIARQSIAGWETQQIVQSTDSSKKLTEKEFLYNELKLKTIPDYLLPQIIKQYETYKGSAIEYSDEEEG